MSQKRFLTPATLSPPFGYSHVVEAQAGTIIYISGQVPLDAKGQLVGAGDFAAQPLVVRTYGSAASRTSSPGASGSKLKSVWMFRHIRAAYVRASALRTRSASASRSAHAISG